MCLICLGKGPKINPAYQLLKNSLIKSKLEQNCDYTSNQFSTIINKKMKNVQFNCLSAQYTISQKSCLVNSTNSDENKKSTFQPSSRKKHEISA